MRYGHTTPRQIVVAPRKAKGGPACEKCRALTFVASGGERSPLPLAVCTKGYDLEPGACGCFDDVSIDRSLND